MARRCTTVPGLGVCCRAMQQGIASGQHFVHNTARGARCAVCTIVQSTSRNPAKAGKQVFQFRFAKGATCGIGPSGCPALGGQQGVQSGTQSVPTF